MNTLLLANPLFGLCPDRKGIYVFGLEIYFYAFCIVGGMIAAAVFSALLMKRRNMSTDFIFTLFLVCIPTAIIGARLFSVLTDGSGIQNFFNFRKGGLSITGGVIGGVLAGFVVCKIKKIEFLRAADCVVVNILIAMVIGRWGNFFNSEVYGLEVTNEALQWFPFAVPVKPNPVGDGNMAGVWAVQEALKDSSGFEWHYAFFFYEGCINLVGWSILFTVAWFRKKKPNGLVMLFTCVWFGFVRMCMEPFRDEAYKLGSKVPVSFWFAVFIWTIAIAAILVLLLVNHYKEGAFVGSAKGDPCGITQFAKSYKDEEPYFSKINMFGSAYPPAPPKEKRKKKSPPEATDGEKKE